MATDASPLFFATFHPTSQRSEWKKQRFEVLFMRGLPCRWLDRVLLMGLLQLWPSTNYTFIHILHYIYKWEFVIPYNRSNSGHAGINTLRFRRCRRRRRRSENLAGTVEAGQNSDRHRTIGILVGSSIAPIYSDLGDSL